SLVRCREGGGSLPAGTSGPADTRAGLRPPVGHHSAGGRAGETGAGVPRKGPWGNVRRLSGLPGRLRRGRRLCRDGGSTRFHRRGGQGGRAPHAAAIPRTAQAGGRRYGGVGSRSGRRIAVAAGG